MVASLNTSRPVLDQDGREGTSRLRSITAATTLSQELHDGQTILSTTRRALLSLCPPRTVREPSSASLSD
jgi:hypothetical protein